MAYPNGKKTFAELTDAERWTWHSDVYAFRRVCLGIFDQTSPADPTGKYYDPVMVDEAERTKRQELAAKQRENKQAFARGAGWSSWQEREDAIRAQKRRELAGDWNPKRWQTPNFTSLADALGVKATEQDTEDSAA